VSAFALVGAKQISLHTLERPGVLRAANEARRYQVEATLFGRRGAILTADGEAVAVDEGASELHVEFAKVPHSPSFWIDLGAASGIAATEFEAVAASGVKGRTWRRPIGSEQAQRVNAVKLGWRADGVSLVRGKRREYPLGAVTAPIVGLTRDGKPVSGLEYSLNSWLSPTSGKKEGLLDRRGSFLPSRSQIEAEPVDGQSVQLTIDSELQSVAYSAVKASVEANRATDGVALVMDTRNGDLLAMATYPSFEPYAADGSPGDLSRNSGFNPATMAVLEPGSTFKALTLAKAIDLGKVELEDTVQCGGSLKQWRGKAIRCDAHHGTRAHGRIDGTKAIAKSCNVSAATWALRIGHKNYVEFLRELGLLERSDLGLPKEAIGQFNLNEPNQLLQLATLGFGQSVNVTPVALVGAFGVLATEGRMVHPRLVKRIGNRDLPIRTGNRVISPRAANDVLSAMEATIETDAGTGRTLRIPGYRLAGKTGTAEKVGAKNRGYVSNFVGYVPAERPRAVVLVMINDPRAGRYYGSQVAGPVFVQIAQTVIRRLAIPPSAPASRAPSSDAAVAAT
jgi:cell division protein FtsI/penicillin-binding protein 2